MRHDTFAKKLADFPTLEGEKILTQFVFDAPEAEIKIHALLSSAGYPAQTTPRALELLSELARVQALQTNFQGTSETLKILYEGLSRLSEVERPRFEVMYLLEQGRLYCLQMTPVQAEACFKKAWLLATEVKDDFLTIDIAVMFSLTQPPKMQKEWLSTALEIANHTTSAKASSWLPLLLVMHGWNLFDLHRFKEALESFTQAASLFEKTANIEKLFSTRWAIGKSLRALGQISESLELQKTLAADLRMRGKTNGYVALEIAECLQLMKNFSEATEHFDEAFKEFSQDQWFKDNRAHELSRILHLSKAK